MFQSRRIVEDRRGVLRKWWWVLTVSGLTLSFYLHSMHGKKIALSELSFRMEEMEKEKTKALQHQEDLLLSISSESDPAWVEMILMRELGVVPEGWLKVHFMSPTSQ